MQINTKKPKLDSLRIAIIFLTSGLALFAGSVFFGSQILCLIGLGLTFWGALFLLIPPPKHVDAVFLITSTLPEYLTIDRMLNYLNPKNEAYNIPPCSRDIFLPKHLEGLKEMVTFIPSENAEGLAEIEDVARSKFLIEKPKGILIASPGSGFLDKIEQKRNMDFTKISLNELAETLPNILRELYLAKEIEMTTIGNEIILQINDSLYKNLYSQKYTLKSLDLLGCPLVNAVACAIAKSAGKPIMIQKMEITANGKTIKATFRIINRLFEDRQKLIDDVGKVPLRRNEIIRVMDSSIRLIDLSFDILVALRDKRINWQRIDYNVRDFGENFRFVGKTIPPMNLDFLKLSLTTKNQLLRETTKEVRVILKEIYDYFDNLNLDEDIKESIPNFLSAKALILVYFNLNDLLLGKVVEDKDNKKEIHQLDSLLQILAKNTEFKLNIEELKSSIDEVIPETEFESVIDDCREIFKNKLKQISVFYS
jgi:hypothetical protein